MKELTDNQLRTTFNQAQVTMPAELQAKLMAIPETETANAFVQFNR